MKLTIGNGLGHIAGNVNHGDKVVIADPGTQSREREFANKVCCAVTGLSDESPFPLQQGCQTRYRDELRKGKILIFSGKPPHQQTYGPSE